jgi:phospholipid/cholesterol/gamma-HCH transport system substrate-binding protein
MKKFRERSLIVVAVVSAVILAIAGYLAINFSHLPLVSTEKTYHAYFATAVGLEKGDVVTISGVRVGKVTGLGLHGNVADVSFSISGNHRLGNETTVDARVLNPVGVEYLAVDPRGPGNQTGAIPESRTSVPGTLVGDLNQFTAQTQQTNLPQLVKSLDVLTQTFAAGNPQQTKAALDGVASLSAVISARGNELDQLITQADQLASLLNSRDAELVQLLGQSNVVLAVLEQRKAAIDSLLATTETLTNQIDHLIVTDRAQLDPLLANLKAVSAYLAQDSHSVGQALPLLAAFSRYAANVAGSGPFADFVAPTLVIPDNLIQQCGALSNAGKISTDKGCRP